MIRLRWVVIFIQILTKEANFCLSAIFGYILKESSLSMFVIFKHYVKTT